MGLRTIFCGGDRAGKKRIDCTVPHVLISILYIHCICITAIDSQGQNLYKLENLSLEPVKIANNFKENNLLTLCLK